MLCRICHGSFCTHALSMLMFVAVPKRKMVYLYIQTHNDCVIQGIADMDEKKPCLALTNQPNFETTGISSSGNLSADQVISPISSLPVTAKPVSQQFWSAGDYDADKHCLQSYRSGNNRLRVHPKFLHSNATSHKWVFGAIAELLDNAVDEIKRGSSFVYLDKFTNSRDKNPGLLIQDDGGGMDPESLRQCMSFGFSNKDCTSIGHYGNGFKTSTMRIGADVIVFSSSLESCTFSIGLLSYTFLRQTQYDDIVVPMVNYTFDKETGHLERLYRHGHKEFSANLSTLLTWSPFSSEEELLHNFQDIGKHGTKVIIFNLWHNDEGNLEINFDTDPEDIIISGVHKDAQSDMSRFQNKNHISRQLRYSLRVYSSVLYLRIPSNFKIILRGIAVEQYYLANELNYIECVKYNPIVGGSAEAEVITVIGFIKGAPQIQVHGFNIYHKNRLILPFFPVVSTSGSRGKGVCGVLQADFIKPTHDKQGFENSAIYQKLITRLKSMTTEYWEHYCEVIGYTPNNKRTSMIAPPVTSCPPQIEGPSKTFEPSSTHSVSFLPSEQNTEELPGVLGKRKHENDPKVEIKRNVLDYGTEDRVLKQPKAENISNVGQKSSENLLVMMETNKNLQKECLQLEESEKALLLKVEMLRSELGRYQRDGEILANYLANLYAVKVEKQ